VTVLLLPGFAVVVDYADAAAQVIGL